MTRGTALVGAGMGIVAVCYGMARFGVGLAAPRIVDEGIVSASQLAFASTGAFVTYVAACALSGVLLGQGRWRASLLMCLLTGSGGCLVLASATTAWVFLTGAAVAGAAAGFASGAIAYRITRDTPAHIEPRAQAVANAGTGAGVALATALIMLPGGWRTLFTAAAVLAILSVLGFLALTRETTRPDTPTQGSETPGRVAALALPVALTMLMGFGSSVFWTFGRSTAEDAASLDEGASLLFWGAIGAAGVVGALSGDLSARFGTRTSWSVSSLLLGASIAGLPFATGLPMAAACGCVFGAVYVIACGLTIEVARQAWPHAMGTGTAILFATIAVGQAAGGGVSGLLLDVIGITGLFTLGGALTALGAGLVWLLPARTSRPPEERDAHTRSRHRRRPGDGVVCALAGGEGTP